MPSCGGLSEPSGPSPSVCVVSEESGTVMKIRCVENQIGIG